MRKRQKGFTLIEIAIVLVIIGLLLGGVLKGQELITGARVRNFIQQQDGIKAAYFGFLDRYRALPGDYKEALANIPNIASTCTTAANGNGNGNGDGQIIGGAQPHENLLVWEHLSKSGFINGSYTCDTTQSSATSPSNPYGSPLVLQYDALFYQGTATASRHNLKTGAQVPSDILAEIDRKVDDGNPAQGSFRAPAPLVAICASATAWVTNPPGADCLATTLF
ncbi:MAG TPA: prepilin-type N-terminal cleavage/methylation domain-containing protein [Burkholderiales bacterium]|nr:prepilin-type N-terminal cleavage/methylation domain-containing protein [Burkholderiales bacterium]